MEALRELAGFLAFLPPSTEQRELFASLAHGLQIPLSELGRAVKIRAEDAARARYAGTAGSAAATPAAPVAPVEVVDELLRPILVLCRDPGILARVAAVPPAWWESLQGAPLLQCLLDAGGDESHIPLEALAQLRHLEAMGLVKDEAERVPDQIFMKLEMGFVEREKQALNRQLQEPGVQVDPRLQARLTQNLEHLLQRARQLRGQMVDLRRKSFSR
jgi:DNA primase